MKCFTSHRALKAYRQIRPKNHEEMYELSEYRRMYIAVMTFLFGKPRVMSDGPSDTRNPN